MSSDLLVLLGQISETEHLESVAEARALLTSSNGLPRRDGELHLADSSPAFRRPALLQVLERLDHRFDTLVDVSGLASVRLGQSTAARPASLSAPMTERSAGVDDGQLRDLLERGVVGARDGDDELRRPYPSAGSLYTVQVLLVVLRGSGSEFRPMTWYHVRPEVGTVEPLCPVTEDDLAELVAPLGDLHPLDCDVLVAYAVVPQIAIAKYGPRGYKFALMEIGLVAQSLTVAATDVGLRSRCWGGFDELGFSRSFGARPNRVYVDLLHLFSTCERPD